MPSKPIVALMPFIECAMRKISSTVSRSSGCSSMRTTARLRSCRCSRDSARNIVRYWLVSMVVSGLAVGEGSGSGESELRRCVHALGGADDEDAARAKGIGETGMERVAHVLVEVDDGVAAEDQVEGVRLRPDAQQVADLEGDHRAQLRPRAPQLAVA